MAEEKNLKISSIKESVFDVLTYFSIFKFPLFFWEIHKYMSYDCSEEELKTVLDNMLATQQIYYENSCYSQQIDKEQIQNKIERFTLAQKRLVQAQKRARLISKFPFVSMVAISGSLSKYSSKPDGDIDYFIVTKHNRLWIARTLLHLFKKFTFLVGKEHDFCMNYFVDTSRLKIEEQNKFTAIEISSLIIQEGEDVFNAFLKENNWIKQFVPNAYKAHKSQKTTTNPSSSQILDSLNIKLMNLTDRKWRLKWKRKGYDMEQYDLAFKTEVSISKNHPKNYQKQILDQYESKH